jgi:hypothetical protein
MNNIIEEKNLCVVLTLLDCQLSIKMHRLFDKICIDSNQDVIDFSFVYTWTISKDNMGEFNSVDELKDFILKEWSSIIRMQNRKINNNMDDYCHIIHDMGQ